MTKKVENLEDISGTNEGIPSYPVVGMHLKRALMVGEKEERKKTQQEE